MPHQVLVDPTPLSPAQVWALLAAAARELSWGIPGAARAARHWRTRAERIPDPPIRDDALYALTHKRTHAEGAALFAVLPRARNRNLLELLVAYETIWDFLDNVNERHMTERNGRELHQALVDAFEPGHPLADYYRHHPWRDDGGYLEELVEFCRSACQELPSFDRVRRLLIQEARRGQVQALNHLPDPARRDSKLERWADAECADDLDEATWYELSGAASASMAIHALLAIAAEAEASERDIATVYAAYWPWISLTTTMLDSYVDWADDIASGDHSYVSHYPSETCAVRRLCQCIAKSARNALELPRGRQHAVIVAAMTAMYLSKSEATSRIPRATTRRLVLSGGSLARLLLPLLRTWRVAYSQRTS
jgi:tetraprenyl-beta-curcumene synthase